MYTADIMGDAVWQNIMGLLTVCADTTSAREKRVQFCGYGITTAGPTTYLRHRILCFGDDLEGMMDIIGIPEWDLFMMEMVDCSGHHRMPIEPY